MPSFFALKNALQSCKAFPITLMQKKGLEPSQYCYHTDLNRARLPIPPLLHFAVFAVITCDNNKYYSIQALICQQHFSKFFKYFFCIYFSKNIDNFNQKC